MKTPLVTFSMKEDVMIIMWVSFVEKQVHKLIIIVPFRLETKLLSSICSVNNKFELFCCIAYTYKYIWFRDYVISLVCEQLSEHAQKDQTVYKLSHRKFPPLFRRWWNWSESMRDDKMNETNYECLFEEIPYRI